MQYPTVTCNPTVMSHYWSNKKTITFIFDLRFAWCTGFYKEQLNDRWGIVEKMTSGVMIPNLCWICNLTGFVDLQQLLCSYLDSQKNRALHLELSSNWLVAIDSPCSTDWFFCMRKWLLPSHIAEVNQSINQLDVQVVTSENAHTHCKYSSTPVS